VLANAKCDVLQGQCIRSNAGLFYENFHEFAETLRAIDAGPGLQAALGRNGRAFFERNYAWPVIEKKYVDMLQQLSGETPSRTMEPMPGWFSRRRRSLPAADSIVKQLPAGPYKEARSEKPEVRSERPEARPQQRFEPRPQQSERPRHDQHRRDGRDGRRDQRPPRTDGQRPQGDRPQGGPQGGRPQGDRQQRPPSPQGARPEGQRPPRPEGARPEGSGRPDNRGGNRRGGRPQRRGRRPGGGGGGGAK
jgi:hypothetical protein